MRLGAKFIGYGAVYDQNFRFLRAHKNLIQNRCIIVTGYRFSSTIKQNNNLNKSKNKTS